MPVRAFLSPRIHPVRTLVRRFLPTQIAPPSQLNKRKLRLESLDDRIVPSGNPVANPDSFTIQQSAALTTLGSVLANDIGGTVPLKGYLDSPATAGTTFAFGSFGAAVRYKPAAGKIGPGGVLANAFVGTDSFTYTLKQGSYTSPTASGTITVANEVPSVAGTQLFFGTARNQSFRVPLANLLSQTGAADADGDALWVVDAAGTRTNYDFATAAGGRVWMSAQNAISYNPPSSSFQGYDTFDIRFWDKAALTQVVSIRVKVGDGGGTGGSPVAAGDAFTTHSGTPLYGNVLTNDIAFGGATLTAAPQTSAPTTQGGHVTLASDGSFMYIPPTGYRGTDSFAYQVVDSYGATASATASIGVTNHAPTASNLSFSTNRATPIVANLLIGASDADGDPLIVSIAVMGPFRGSIELDSSTGAFTYTPALDWVGIETISFTVSDGVGGSVMKTVTVDVEYESTVVSIVKISDAMEGNAIGTFHFTRTGDPAAALTVAYFVSGSATSGTDYRTIGGSVIFAAGDTEVEIDVEAFLDLITEENDAITLTLEDGEGYSLGIDTEATVALFDAEWSEENTSYELPEGVSVANGTGESPEMRVFVPPAIDFDNRHFESLGTNPDRVQFTKTFSVRLSFDNTIATVDGTITEKVKVSAFGWRRFDKILTPNGNDGGEHVAYIVVLIEHSERKVIDGPFMGNTLENTWKTIGFDLPYGVFLRSVNPSVNDTVSKKMVIENGESYTNFVNRFIQLSQAIPQGGN